MAPDDVDKGFKIADDMNVKSIVEEPIVPALLIGSKSATIPFQFKKDNHTGRQQGNAILYTVIAG